MASDNPIFHGTPMTIDIEKIILGELNQLIDNEEDITVEIGLPLEVARTLLFVCGHIAGDPTATRRGHIDLIGHALRDAGVTELANIPIEGQIQFLEGEARYWIKLTGVRNRKTFSKIDGIKTLRQITGMRLKDAKDTVDEVIEGIEHELINDMDWDTWNRVSDQLMAAGFIWDDNT